MHITKPEHNETVQSAGYSSLDGGSASAPLSSGERECDAPTAETCCSTATDQTTAGVEPREPCPTPLAWQHVVRAVANESQAWELDRGEYVLRGRTFGTGKPLYFLNGLGGTHELYALTAWLLRDEFRCVLYDYPAAETKSARRAKLSVERLAADLFAAAGLHEDERFCVYAATFGTPLALQAALQQPGRIERAVLQGAFAHRRLSPAERLLAAVCRRLPGRLEQVPGRRVVQEQNHRRWFPPYDITRWRFLLENTGQVPVSALAQRAGVLARCDLRGRLGEISTPVLLIQTEGEGTVAARCREELEAGLPNARTEYLHTSGHVVYLTHPHRLTKLIKPFLLSE